MVYLSDKNNALAFVDKPSRENTVQRLIEAGFAVRLMTPQGKIVDGFGKYQEVPLWIPNASGYTRVARNKADWRLISQPVIRQGQIIGWLQIAKSLEALEKISQELLT